jgi:predicted RNA-binding protein associated with RNAse of E/G family
MEIYKFIETEKINNFESLKLKLEEKPYNLKLKEDVNFPNLFLIHSQETSDFSIPLVNECNGIILEKNTFKIICYTFNKSSDIMQFDPKLNLNELYVEYALEGTLIRLFY